MSYLCPPLSGKAIKLSFSTSPKTLSLRFDFGTGMVAGSDGKASAYNAGDPGSIPGLARPSGEGNGNSSTLAGKIPWMEEHDKLQSKGSQRVGHD